MDGFEQDGDWAEDLLDLDTGIRQRLNYCSLVITLLTFLSSSRFCVADLGALRFPRDAPACCCLMLLLRLPPACICCICVFIC